MLKSHAHTCNCPHTWKASSMLWPSQTKPDCTAACPCTCQHHRQCNANTRMPYSILLSRPGCQRGLALSRKPFGTLGALTLLTPTTCIPLTLPSSRPYFSLWRRERGATLLFFPCLARRHVPSCVLTIAGFGALPISTGRPRCFCLRLCPIAGVLHHTLKLWQSPWTLHWISVRGVSVQYAMLCNVLCFLLCCDSVRLTVEIRLHDGIRLGISEAVP
jgi:hypothetical protein